MGKEIGRYSMKRLIIIFLLLVSTVHAGLAVYSAGDLRLYDSANSVFLPIGGFATDTTTVGNNSLAAIVFSFDVSGTDHTMTAGNGLMTFSNDIQANDDITAGGRFFASDGVATAPAYSFTGGSNSGMFFGGGNAIEFSLSDDTLLRLTAGQATLSSLIFDCKTIVAETTTGEEHDFTVLSAETATAQSINLRHKTTGDMTAGFALAMAFAEDSGAIDSGQAKKKRDWAWDILLELGDTQGGRVEEEAPAWRFLEGLKTLINQGRVAFSHKDDLEPPKASPSEIHIGWRGEEGYLLLDPAAAYKAVYEFWRGAGEPFTVKRDAVWKDLKRRRLSVAAEGRTKYQVRIYGTPERVIKLKERALEVGYDPEAAGG